MVKLINNLYVESVPDDLQQFLRTNTLSELPEGRYDFSNGVYLNISVYNTKSRAEGKYEAHRQYIDIQYVISGEEIICVNNIQKLDILENYNATNDCIFYSNSKNGQDYIMNAGDGMIIHPEDGHMPGMQCVEGKPVNVKKMVIKVPIN